VNLRVVRVVVAAVIVTAALPLPADAGLVRKIVFTRFVGGTMALYSVNPDGSNLVRITAEDVWAQDPSISPDGAKVAFANCPRRCNLFVVNIDGTEPTRLTSGTPIESHPVWSPDGSKIAFSRAEFYDAGAALYVMNADGSGQTAITGDRWHNSFPSWSPDGSQLVFARYQRSDYELYRAAGDASEVTRLTDNRGQDHMAQWSPDGSRIVYSFAPRSFGDYEIISIAPDGTDKVRLTLNDFRDDMVPQWSPAGDRIAFVRCQGTTCHLYAMNADGSAKNKLVDGEVESLSHAWAPDGSEIALSRLTRHNRYDVFTVGSGGDGLTNLTATRWRDEATVDW
jgi:Tol biopolymer transport system component